MNIIEQTDSGKLMAVSYQDHGMFQLLIINDKGETIDKIFISDFIDNDHESLPIDGFHEPLTTCCFQSD